MRQRKVSTCICVMLMFVILPLPIQAEIGYEAQICDAISAFVPEEVSEAVGGLEALFTEDGIENLGARFVLRIAGQAFKSVMRPVLAHFAMLFGMILIVGAAGLLKSDRMEPIVSLICTLTVALTSYSLIDEHLSVVAKFIQYLTSFMTAMFGVMEFLWTVGGNVAEAALTGSSMFLALTVLENIAEYVLSPLLMLCFALALVTSMCGELRGIASFVRTTFSTVLGFVTMLLMTMIGSQNTIAQSADNHLMRTVRFAAGAFIPVVRGAVSEAASTIAGGIDILKSMTGTVGVVILLVTTLPVILSLFLERASFHLAAESARIMGIESAAGFLGEVKSLFDLAIGLVCAFDMMFVFSMIFFAKCSTVV